MRNEVQLGDIVSRRPANGELDESGRRVHECKPAEVVYIHPKKRFHTVRFLGTGIRECYKGVRA